MNEDKLTQANELHLQLSIVTGALQGVMKAKDSRDLWSAFMNSRVELPDTVLAQMQEPALRWLDSERSRLRDEFGAL
jgi:hypothetical protein